MAWMLVHPQIQNIFASLGVQQGDAYKVSEDCLAILSDILKKLSLEDRTLRTFRRAIGFGQHIRRDLLPLLIHVKDDTKTTDTTKILDATIKILVNLTIPVECLLSMDALSKTDIGRHTIFDINKLLYSSKEAFVDSRSIKAVTDHMKFMIKAGAKLEIEQCDSINNCLLLLRNILHVPEHRMQISNWPLAHSSMQNRILWNLFTQSIDKLLLNLMNFPQKIYWVVTMVQLIALMYKDQHVGSLQKLLNVMFEASLSESSDDNESNTSPPPPNQASSDSSPMLTSDPTTSDSSDNGGSCGKVENIGKNQNSIQINNNNSNVKQHIVRSQQNRNKVLLTSQKQKANDDSSSTSSHGTDSNKKDDQQATASVFDSSMNLCHYMNAFRAQKRKLSQPAHRNEHMIVNSSSTNHSETSSVTKTKDNINLQSELSDYGYGTQVENQESISTSSNDDELPQQKPIHQKPHMVQKPRNKTRSSTPAPKDKKEHRRKKLIKRSKINIINIKGLLHHSPSDEDISNILKEFTVDFLLKGYGSLVHELYNQKLSDSYLEIDTSHIFWLVTYFLKFATQLELEFEHIHSVLSFNVLAYLTYEGVNICEQLEIGFTQPGTDLKPNLRRMHLVVTAIKEFLSAIEAYKKITHLSKDDKTNLIKLQIQIASTSNIKNLLILLIRCYNSEFQSKNYLQDLIITNHILLLFLDNAIKLDDYKGNNNIEEHLKHFANVDVMQKYGYLLDDFENNGKYINDCIFTMMHHIGGDIDNVATLFQPNILKTFSRIWESGYEICDDWSDLIEYVIHKFINVPRQPSHANIAENLNNISSNSKLKKLNKREVWSEEELDSLYWYYIQSRTERNVIENIEKLYIDNGVTNKTRTEIIEKLFERNIINKKSHDEYLIIENPNQYRSNDNANENKEYNDIKILKEKLVQENMGNSILWLQKNLLEVCHCKVMINNKDSFKEYDSYEPIPYCYIKLNQSIPIVPWTRENKNILKNHNFISLLHKLGFHLSMDTRKLYIRIPHFWTADHTYRIIQKLGPVDPETLTFDLNLLKNDDKSPQAQNIETNKKQIEEEATTTLIQYPLLLNATTSWFQPTFHTKVRTFGDFHPSPASPDIISISIPETKISSCEESPHTKSLEAFHVVPESVNIETDKEKETQILIETIKEESDIVMNANDEFEHNSISDTASVASDLTRMYVSDEEDKQ